MAHSPFVDADLSDWCLGAASNGVGQGRVEDSGALLSCGNCSVTTDRACVVASDCPAGESCTNLGSKEELVWWDNRTDGAVNDLGTVAITFDNDTMYISAELWVDPDPVSLPFGQVAIDIAAGGNNKWHDPLGVMAPPGHCSVSTDRGCTTDNDCHFCAVSTEPFPSNRLRTCGSDGPAPVGDGICSDLPGDSCIATETCVDVGAGGLSQDVGLFSSPVTGAEYLIVFDFSFWLIGAGDATAILENQGGNWVSIGTAAPAVNPGASGGSGGPPGGVEVAIPWGRSDLTNTRFTMIIARGTLTLDFVPDGAIEDLMSEPVAGTTSLTQDSCPGMGLGNTLCELDDGSADAYIPGLPSEPGGRIVALRMDKGAGAALNLMWNPSCSSADSDYEVYEGRIGTWYSHVQLPGLCTTGGATSAMVAAPGAGGRYYLVVPSDGISEGSYGEDSGAIGERPASTAACRIQSLGNCP